MGTKPDCRVYDSIGQTYSGRRRPDPRIASMIRKAIGDCETVCNVGAGTGSYEPSDCFVVAVEPSSTMIAQRISNSPVVRGVAEHLPFKDNSFDVALAILTVHHWEDSALGLLEMARISRRQVLVTYDPAKAAEFWLVRDYLPEIEAFDRDRTPSLAALRESLPGMRVEPLPVPADCVDGFQAAYWRRPEMYLRADVRASISTFAQLPTRLVERAISQLHDDLESGAWLEKNKELQNLEQRDFGYCLITAES